MKKTYVTFLSLCLMMVALAANAAVRTWDFTKWSEATIANLKAEADSVTVVEPAEPIFPINEALTENTGKFENGEIITGKYVNGMVAKGGKGTATLSFDTDEATEGVQAYAVAENEVVTFSWVAYQGWMSAGKQDKVEILNSEGKVVFGYSYDLTGCSITDIQLAGATAPMFEAFMAQGYVGSKSANGWTASGQEYQADNAYNTVVTVKVYGKGYVEVNMKNEKRGYDKTYGTMLPADFKVDLASLNLTNVNANTDRSLGMNQLSITAEEAAAAFIDYTVSRQCGEEVIGTYTATGMVGKDVVLPTSPFYTENGQKYIYKDDTADRALAEDNKEFIISYEKAAKYSWVLNAVDAEGNVLKKIKEGKAFQDDAVTVSYPRYVLLEGTEGAPSDSLLYEAGVNNKEYNHYITMDADSKQVNVKYTAKAGISRVVYYSEAEDMSNYYKKELTTGNAAIRASQGKAVYTTYDASICTLPAGVYKLTVGLFDATRNLGDTLKFNNNRSEVATFITADVNLTEQSKEIVLAAEKNSLSWVAGGSENWGLDYLFIEKVSDDVPYTVAANIAEAKTLNGTPVALTLTNAKVNLSTLHEDMYPQYTLIEDETGALALERQFAAKLLEATGDSLKEGKQYTGTLYGTFGFDSNSRPVFYLTGKSLKSTLEATDCVVVPVEVAVSDINTDEGMIANFGKYINLKNVEFGKVVGEWGGADYYLIATRTIANGDSATTEVKDSIMLYDNYYIFPENIPNFTSFTSINGFVDKFYDGTITFYPFGEYSAEVKPATRVANIGELKNIEDGEDIILTLDKAVVTLYTMGHSGNLVLLEDAKGGVQLQTGDGWFVQEGLADVIGVTRDSLQLDGTLYCRVENGGMLVLNDSTQAMSQVTVSTELVPVKPTVVALNKVLDNNYLNRLIQVKSLDFTVVETPDPYYPESVMKEPYLIQNTDTIGVYDMFQLLEYDEQYNVVDLGYLKSVTGIIIEGSEATSWSPATPNTLAPIAYEEATFKEFTTNEKVAMTEENINALLAEGWFEYGWNKGDKKKGNIDIQTGEEVAAANMPFATVKKGNSAKDVTVYVTGLEKVKGFGASTSSKDVRALMVTATNTETGEVTVAKAEAGLGVTGVAEVALNKESDYIVNFTGMEGENGGDVALFGIWFIADEASLGITEVTNNSNANATFNGELYNVSGIKVRNAGESRNGLSKGIYLMKNGKKAVIK